MPNAGRGHTNDKSVPLTADNIGAHVVQALKEISDPIVINRFHDYSDKNGDRDAGHHSLGNNPEHSAPGDHTHDGQNGRKIFNPTSISGVAGNAVLTSLLQALAAQGIIINDAS